jgi:hypothetical protein
MGGAGAEAPASGRFRRLVEQDQGFVRTARTDFEAMIRAVDAGLAETAGFGEEDLFLFHFAHGKQRAVETADGFGVGDLGGDPAVALLVGILNDFDDEAGGMFEVDEVLAEAFMDAAMDDPMFIQVIDPEGQGSFGDGIDGGLDLARPGTALDPLVRKSRHDGAGLGFAVGVIEVIVRVAAVKQNGLFDQTLSDHLGKEIDVFLRAAGTGGDVMQPCNGIIHKVEPPRVEWHRTWETGVKGPVLVCIISDGRARLAFIGAGAAS